MALESPNAPDHHRNIPWIAGVLVVLAGVALIAFLETCQGTREVVRVTGQAVDTMRTAVKELPDLAAKFKTGTITHTFVEQNLVVSPTKGDVLELATTQQDETFTKQDYKSVLWETVNLGTTTSEIRVPVTFRYHLRLSDPWRLATRDNVCLVLAPKIRPSQPPAIHTQGMVKETKGGWARFNQDENLQELEASLTTELEGRAADPSHQRLVREACRQSVAEFVRGWLVREDRWREDRFTSIVVVFPDELPANSDAELEQYRHDPTVQLQRKN